MQVKKIYELAREFTGLEDRDLKIEQTGAKIHLEGNLAPSEWKAFFDAVEVMSRLAKDMKPVR